MEDDLIEACQSGKLSGACLDVFREEPLPHDSPLWSAPGVRVTPHIAAWPDPKTSAEVVAENFRRMVAGEELLYVVHRDRGY